MEKQEIIESIGAKASLALGLSLGIAAILFFAMMSIFITGESLFLFGWFFINGYSTLGLLSASTIVLWFAVKMLARDIIKTHYVIYDNSSESMCLTEGVGDIRIGPDGRLYVANYSRHYLHVVTNPNERGRDLDFQFNRVYLEQGRSSWRLPNFVESLFREPDTEMSCPQKMERSPLTMRTRASRKAPSYRLS